MSEKVLLQDSLSIVPTHWIPAYEWFWNCRGTVISFPSPSPVASMKHVISTPKGIYKPNGDENPDNIAFSVKETMTEEYANRPVQQRPNGSWVYLYHQEGNSSSFWTNKALFESCRRRTPVVVLIQVSKYPSKYLVQGLAVVANHSDGYFWLEGFSTAGIAEVPSASDQDVLLAGELIDWSNVYEFDVHDLDYDQRDRGLRLMVKRQGQGPFREQLLSIYSERCVITGCSVNEVLDAAHILPFKGAHTNIVQNGILIRTDLHNLLDRGLLSFDPTSRRTVVSTRLRGSEYWKLRDIQIANPGIKSARPPDYLLQRYMIWCGQRLTS